MTEVQEVTEKYFFLQKLQPIGGLPSILLKTNTLSETQTNIGG